MVHRSLREFIKVLEKNNEIKRIETEVDPVLEITEITDRVVKKAGPALFFSNVKGSEYPVLINAFGSMKRMELALGVDNINEIGKRIEEYFNLSAPENFFDKVKLLPVIKELNNYIPKNTKDAPCQEVIEENVDLYRLPVLKCWPGDGGRFFTLPVVYTKDPDSGRQNAGMYRMQIYDYASTGMHWHIHKDGADNYRKYKNKNQKMEVAVAIGADPAVIYSSTAPLPAMIDEMIFAGFLRGKPVEMVKCQSVNLKVPARAEFILEGYIDPAEQKDEGPFGDHTGYYSNVDSYPVFHITTITHRYNPIYHATVVGRPPMEDCYLAKATERIFLPLLKLLLPEIIDINLPLEGVFHNCAIVSIHKNYPGQARKVMHALWGLGQMMYTKMLVVVDAHVDVQDLSAVAWRVFNNIDPGRDLVITDGPLDVLDHSSSLPFYGSKLGIDATKTWPEEGYKREWPPEIKMDEKIKQLVDQRWAEYGIHLE